MTIRYGQEIAGNIAFSRNIEWLLTNGIGGYAAGTVAGLRTRRYHGLLIGATNPPVGRDLLVPAIDDSIVRQSRRGKVSDGPANDSTANDSTALRLSSIEWSDGSVDPCIASYIDCFELRDGIPFWSYRIDGIRIEKSIRMEQGVNATLIRYRVDSDNSEISRQGEQKPAAGPGEEKEHTGAPSPAPDEETGSLTLRIKVFAANRNHHGTSRGYPGLAPELDGAALVALDAEGQAVSRAQLRYDSDSAHDAPEACGDLSARGALRARAGDAIYEGVRLSIEGYRGLDDTENLWVLGEIEAPLPRNGSVTLRIEVPGEQVRGAGVEEQRPPSVSTTTPRVDDRSSSGTGNSVDGNAGAADKPDWIVELERAAGDFIVDRRIETGETGKTIIAGYPWFGDWGRDTMISLPGITLTTGREDDARWIIRTFAKYVNRGMLPNLFPDGTSSPAYNSVDAPLWYFEAIRAYFEKTGDMELLSEVYPVLESIITWFRRGTRFGIGQDPEDGLLKAGEEGVQLTWMDAKVGDWVVTPRVGKPVEINALWHHAFLVMGAFADILEKHDAAPGNAAYTGEQYDGVAAEISKSFDRFWNDGDSCLYDVLDTPWGDDPAVRPNQIFVLSLQAARAKSRILEEAPLLSSKRRRSLFSVVEKKLYTPVGLRSLSPDDPSYTGSYGGDVRSRDGSYHQGTVWGWLLGPYIRSHNLLYGDQARTARLFEPVADRLRTGCLGTLSEIYDGNPPHFSRGAFAQAWSVAEIVWSWHYLYGTDTHGWCAAKSGR